MICVAFTESEIRALLANTRFVEDVLGDEFEALGVRPSYPGDVSPRDTAIGKLQVGLTRLRAAEPVRVN